MKTKSRVTRHVAKRMLAMLLCLILAAGLLSACKTKTEDNFSDEKNSQETPEEKTDSKNSEDTSSEEKTGQANEETDKKGENGNNEGTQTADSVELPLTEEKETLSVWTIYFNDFVEDPNEVKGVQKMEELTNVHIDWQVVLSAEAQEKFGLLMASGNYPDIIYFARATATQQYTGGMEKAIADGVLVDSTPLIDNYMPHYKQLMEAYEDARVESTTDTGLKVIWSYSANDQGPCDENEWAGLVIRQDWLEELNLPVPETLEEWHDTLLAFKEKKGADAPLMVGPTGYTRNNAFLTAFGILAEYYQKDGKVFYGPAQPEYKEYIDLMASWYQEGLLDPNFMSNKVGSVAPNEYVVNGRTGAFPTIYSMANQGMISMGLVTDQPDFSLLAVKNPVREKGEQPRTAKIADGIVNSMIGITTGCKNPELAARWLDFNYTTEGMLLNMYGIENESYTIAADGTYQFTEEILQNSEYGPTDALKFWARGNGLGLYNWETAMRTYANYEEILEIEQVWTEQDMSLCLPRKLFMTEEEANRYTNAYTAIQTLVQENTCNWIQGAATTDNFDGFVDSLYQYGLQECIDIQQALLDRYNVRK